MNACPWTQSWTFLGRWQLAGSASLFATASVALCLMTSLLQCLTRGCQCTRQRCARTTAAGAASMGPAAGLRMAQRSCDAMATLAPGQGDSWSIGNRCIEDKQARLVWNADQLTVVQPSIVLCVLGHVPSIPAYLQSTSLSMVLRQFKRRHPPLLYSCPGKASNLAGPAWMQLAWKHGRNLLGKHPSFNQEAGIRRWHSTLLATFDCLCLSWRLQKERWRMPTSKQNCGVFAKNQIQLPAAARRQVKETDGSGGERGERIGVQGWWRCSDWHLGRPASMQRGASRPCAQYT